MLREVFTHPNPWAIAAMLGCIALFALVVYYVASDRRRGHLERMQNLPLEDERHG